MNMGAGLDLSSYILSVVLEWGLLFLFELLYTNLLIPKFYHSGFAAYQIIAWLFIKGVSITTASMHMSQWKRPMCVHSLWRCSGCIHTRYLEARC